MSEPTIRTPIEGEDPSRIRAVGEGRSGDPARAAFWLGLLGIPTFGITAIAGIGVGLLGFRRARPLTTVAATVWCFLVLVFWLGGLVGVLEIMNSVSARPVSIRDASGRFGDALAARIARGVDPGAPEAPDSAALARLVDRMPSHYRRHSEGATLLAIEPLPTPQGTFLRWRIGLPLDIEVGESVTTVRPESGQVLSYASDGRRIWSFERIAGPAAPRLDDESRSILAATLPAARLVVAEASNGGGVLPPPIEVARRLAASDLEITPVYRARPGGLFDLFVPGTRSYATYAVCGGVLVPIRR